MRRIVSGTVARWCLAGVLLGGWLANAGCREPIVPRGPEQLYELAREQLRNENYVRAVDTLARVAREAPDSSYGVKAGIIRLAVLAGLARSAQALGEFYLEIREQMEDSGRRSELYTAALDQFTLGQSWALALLEALSEHGPALAEDPLVIDPVLPITPAPEHPALARLRAGERISESERRAIERDAVRRGMAEMMTALLGEPGNFGRAYDRLALGQAEVSPAAVRVVFGHELVRLSRLFGQRALNQPRYERLFQERALALAEQVLAEGGGSNTAYLGAAEELKRQSQALLRGR